MWSDQFRFGYFTPGHNGWIQTLDGAVRGTDDEIPAMQPDAQFGDPARWTVRTDDPLLRRLFTCWRQCYLQNRHRRRFRRLFRSLEVAFHASLFPADGLTSINDIGTRLALWVSAFEVLCHPLARSITKRDVQAFLQSAPFDRRELLDLRYSVLYQRVRYRATLPAALYDDLYWSRNQFLHGMPVASSALHYRQSPMYVPLIQVAPVLYSAAIVSFLAGVRIGHGPLTRLALGRHGSALRRYIESRSGFEVIQDALMVARSPIDARRRPLRRRAGRVPHHN
jgi:hypothetical protein